MDSAVYNLGVRKSLLLTLAFRCSRHDTRIFTILVFFLISCDKIFFDNEVGPQRVKNSACCGIRWLQEHATGSYPEQDTSIPHPPLALFKMHFNIVLPVTPRSYMRPLSIRCSIRNLVCNFLIPSVCNMPCRSHPPWFDHRNKI